MTFNINQDTALMRGVRTAIQAMLGFVVGLVGAVWAVPGVPEAVHNYISQNAGAMALSVGLPAAVASGLVAFGWNALRKDVKNA